MAVYENQISFRRGIDRHGAQPPPGFPHRFAVLTWFHHGADSAEPWPLVRAAVPQLMALAVAETVRGEIWQRKHLLGIVYEKRLRTAPLSEWLEKTDTELHALREFPAKLRFERGGNVVLWMASEMWNQVGGPEPYHDSVALSFFSKADIGDQLEAIFRAAAADIGVAMAATAGGARV